MTKMKGIILDENYSSSLFKTKQNLSQSNIYQEALVALLLYEKAYIPGMFLKVTNKYLEEFIKEDLISIIPSKFYNEEENKVLKIVSNYQDNILKFKDLTIDRVDYSIDNQGKLNAISDLYEKEILRDESISDAVFIKGHEKSKLKLQKEIIWEYYKKSRLQKSKKYDAKILSDFAIDFCEHLVITENNSIDDIINFVNVNDKEFRQEIEENIDKYYEQETYDLSVNQLRNLLNRYEIKNQGKNKTELLKAFRNQFLNNEFDLYNLNIEKLHFYKYFVKYNELTSFSYSEKIPIKGEIGTISAKRDIAQLNSVIPNYENSYSIYKIILDEIEFLPRLHSMEDVLRLRGDRRLSDFREVIFEWSKAFHLGDYNQVNKLRKEIRKSNLEFKRLKNYQRIGGWVAYASLPCIGIDLLTGFPVGQFLTAIGGGVQFGTNRLNKKNKWLLFGNRL